MAQTFYFYDLETSGIKPSFARVMQFAGQRTDMHLKPIGQPHNIFIKMTPDILPDPDAVLVTGITPQYTHQHGISEAEFIKIFDKEINIEGTIFIGFNSVRFDDEFMRYLMYRNFYDPYEWQWKDGRSRWDLLDVARMTRALRPDGIKWPVDSSGKPSNRLGLLTSINKLGHDNAHDALSDVKATINLAILIQKKQPKLFSYLLQMRDKDKIAELVDSNKPFVYSSGKYPNEFEKTTVVAKVCDHPKRRGVLVYDLRHDPSLYLELSAEKLAELWKWQPSKPSRADGVQGAGEQRTKPYQAYGEGAAQSATPQPAATNTSGVTSYASKQAGVAEGLERLPVKTMQFNRCPAVAPFSVLDKESKIRLKIDEEATLRNYQLLKTAQAFPQKLKKALEILDKMQQEKLFSEEHSVDEQLYDGFINDNDRKTMRTLRSASPDNLQNFVSRFSDERLKFLLPLYKARNYPDKLSSQELEAWEVYRSKALQRKTGGLEQYFKRLEELKAQGLKNKNQQYIIEELRLYGESILS